MNVADAVAVRARLQPPDAGGDEGVELDVDALGDERAPLLAIAGSDDGSTPADLVRETADLVPGAEFALIRGAGHLPCAECGADSSYFSKISKF